MSLRKGWCPGALRPMQTGDGFLVRLRLTGGIVPAAKAQAIAGLALRFGNGLIDLSQRANLQLRGVREVDLPALTRALDDLGLIDASAAGEAVRNVIASPLAGLDASAALDIRPVVAALEARLSGDAALHALPGKFGFVVEDGGALALDGVAGDVRFLAVSGSQFAVFLDGCGEEVAACAPDDVPEMAARIALAFLAAPGARRMRECAETVRAILQNSRMNPLPRGDGFMRVATQFLPGFHTIGHLPFLALAAPFGRLHAHQLAAFATEIRLTPWRVIFAPGLEAAALPAFAAAGWIATSDDPRLRAAACPGAPACASATTPVQDHAAALAPLMSRGNVSLHVSGCAKGCAHHAPARFTLVARAGLYDLVENATATDAPALTGLAFADLPEILRARMNAVPSGAPA